MKIINFRYFITLVVQLCNAFHTEYSTLIELASFRLATEEKVFCKEQRESGKEGTFKDNGGEFACSSTSELKTSVWVS